MGIKTKIDWADATWNPVTGCLHGCEYCYARRIAERFRPEYVSGMYGTNESEVSSRTNYELKEPMRRCRYESDGVKLLYEKTAYPFGFVPTFHRYRLEEPQRWKKPRNIFVCSMADLFGEWVPDEWIDDVIKATQRALQHRYLFLTKNPERYGEWLERFEEGRISELDELENCWFGASASNNAELERANRSRAQWVSIEPIRERIETDEDQFMEFNPYTGSERKRWAWVVIGAETGNSKNKVAPKREWIDDIATACADYGTPVFMKESLRELMGDDFRQEFPWEV